MSNEVARNNRTKFIALILLMLSPVVASVILHNIKFRPDSTVNYGELLEVKAIHGQAHEIENNTIFRERQLHGKWSFVMIDSGNCEEYCQKKLYQMRQVRLAQNTEKDRINRIWFIDDQIVPNQEIKKEFEGTVLLTVNDSEFLDQFPAVSSKKDHIYVIDPMGNLMMRYPRDANPSKMANDIKLLLKLSHLEHK